MFYSSFSTVFLSFKLHLNPFPHPLISLYSCSALPLPFFHFLCDFIRLQYNCYSAEFSEKFRNLFVGNCKKSDFPRSTYVIAFCYFTTSHSSPSNTFKVFAPKKSDPSCLDSSLLLSFYPPVWIPLKYLEYEVLGINRAHMSTRVFFSGAQWTQQQNLWPYVTILTRITTLLLVYFISFLSKMPIRQSYDKSTRRIFFLNFFLLQEPSILLLFGGKHEKNGAFSTSPVFFFVLQL